MPETYTAGQKLRASQMPAPYTVAALCSGNLVQSTTVLTAIPGATVTFTTRNATASVLIMGIFDITTTTGGTGTASGYCQVNGSTQSQQAIWDLVTAGARGTLSQTWTANLTTPGSQTIDLLANLNTASGSATFSATHTTITVLVMDY